MKTEYGFLHRRRSHLGVGGGLRLPGQGAALSQGDPDTTAGWVWPLVTQSLFLSPLPAKRRHAKTRIMMSMMMMMMMAK